MSFLTKVTFSKKISLILYGMSFLILGYTLASVLSLWQANLWIFVFILGLLTTYPMINYCWKDVKENWNRSVSTNGSSYKDMFLGELDDDEKKAIVKNHWKNVWWIIPYAIIIYFYVSSMVAYLFGTYGILPYFGGSILSIGLVSYEYQKGFDI